jgi:hypothetical protein
MLSWGVGDVGNCQEKKKRGEEERKRRRREEEKRRREEEKRRLGCWGCWGGVRDVANLENVTNLASIQETAREEDRRSHMCCWLPNLAKCPFERALLTTVSASLYLFNLKHAVIMLEKREFELEIRERERKRERENQILLFNSI